VIVQFVRGLESVLQLHGTTCKSARTRRRPSCPPRIHTRAAPAAPPLDGPRAPLFFFEETFQDAIVEREISHHVFQTLIFVFELAQATRFAQLQPAVLGFPPVERRRGDDMRPRHIGNGPLGIGS
jgi:hypothetical protein